MSARPRWLRRDRRTFSLAERQEYLLDEVDRLSVDLTRLMHAHGLRTCLERQVERDRVLCEVQRRLRLVSGGES